MDKSELIDICISISEVSSHGSEHIYQVATKVLKNKELREENKVLKSIVSELTPDIAGSVRPILFMSTKLFIGSEEHKAWQRIHLEKYPENL